MNNPNTRDAIRRIRKATESPPLILAALKPIKVVAFLQNVWHPQPERVHAFIERFGRKTALPKLLFGLGGKTGRVLLEHVGEGLCDRIVWEETSKEITGKANGCPKPDLAHMRAVLDEHTPDVVLLLGKVAADAWRALGDPREALQHVHPARAPAEALAALRRDCSALAVRAGVPPP